VRPKRRMENLNIALTHSGQFPSSYPSTAKWKEILEARSYVASVTKEHIVTVTQEELNEYDLVVNTDECINYPQQSKLRGLTVPVLNMNDRLYDLLKIATGGGSVYEIADLIIKDNTHEITEEYSEDETITGYSSPYYIMRFYNVAEDFQVLGKVFAYGSYLDSLIVMEVGGKFLDNFENTSRFASFPFYRPNDTYELTPVALTLLDRVIAWLLASATYTPLDYVDVIKFNVLKRDRAFSVARRKKSFSVLKRAKNFKVEIK
jgi:hypothetical protein